MKRNAFTLIEILVVVSIIGILSTIGLITYSGTQAKARDSIRKADLQKLSLALEGYFQKNGQYVPPGDTGVDSCQRDTDKFYQDITPFFQGDVPKDPQDGTSYCYIAVDEGTSYRLFSKLESCQDEKAISSIDCQKISYRYSLVSDDLTVTPAFDDIVGGNLLANAGFENGLSSWTWWTAGSLITDATVEVETNIVHSGSNSVELSYRCAKDAGSCNPSTFKGVMLGQIFARNALPGQTYDIFFWARSTAATTVKPSVYVTESSQTPILKQSIIFFNTGPAWNQYSGTFIVPTNWAGKDLQIVLLGDWTGYYSDTVGKPTLYDDILVTKGMMVTPPLGSPPPTPTPTPTPSPTPIPASTAYKRVFITSQNYSGNLGGLSGADSKCQAKADAANLGGTWKAWLSDGSISASSRLTHATVPYKLLDDTKIADNWGDLTDGFIRTFIRLTEILTTPSANNVWTGSFDNGDIGTDFSGTKYHCSNWSTASTIYGITGYNLSTENWSNNSIIQCLAALPLYCFEQ